MSSSTEVTPEKQQQNVEKVEAGAASTDAVQPEDTTAEKQKILAPIPSVNVWQVRKSSSSPNSEEAAPIAAEKPEQPAQEGK
jgi:hypothetical protein